MMTEQVDGQDAEGATVSALIALAVFLVAASGLWAGQRRLIYHRSPSSETAATHANPNR